MLGSLVQRLQSLSPVTSPVSSPKASRRRPAPLRRGREDYREVQSEPEVDDDAKKGARRLLPDKRKAKRRDAFASNAPLHGSKSLGRLDGLKEVLPT